MKRVVTALLLTLSLGSFAALPPEVEEERVRQLHEDAERLKAQATDVVVFEVLDADYKKQKSSSCYLVKDWTIEAEVISADNKGELTVDKVFEFHYETEQWSETGCVGPNIYSLPVLKEGSRYRGYFKCNEERCTLSGGILSFETP